MKKVVITDLIADELRWEREILGDIARVEALDATFEEELLGRIEDADAVMLYHKLAMTAASINRLERCKLIVRCGVGYDNVDHALARRRGIDVANVPDYGTEEVADSALGMMLTMTRGLARMNLNLQAGRTEWTYHQIVPLHRLRGRTFCIVGLGRIGTAAAVRAKAFGMDVVFLDPYRPDGVEKSLGIRRVETLDELLREAFVVSLHCPLSAETHHLIDAEAIAAMPPGGFLINTARGGVVDTSALPAALASGYLAGAAIDVLELEPPRADDPLLAAWRDASHPAHDRLLLNPHAAFYCEEGLIDIRRKAAGACRRALLGERPRNVIN